MWERRSYLEGAGQRCTVKYKGTIPPWKDEAALGVEWDDSSRGRNSGSLDGVAYFACDVPGAGSFIKASRAPEPRQTLQEAVEKSYLVLENETNTVFGESKGAEMYGFDKTYARQQRLDELTVVAVIEQRVYSLECKAAFRSLQQLELNDNLFEDFSTLVAQLAKFSRLRTLSLNGNRMQYPPLTTSTPTVLELSMARTMIHQNDVVRIREAFPNLQSLNLASNRLTEFPDTLPSSLRALDLSCNLIESVFYTFENVPLDALVLTDNPLANFEVDASHRLPNKLDLRGTPFSWERVSLIGASQAAEVSFRHAEQALEYRSFAIARCPNVSILDGTEVSRDERANAEMYTLSMVARKKHPDLPPPVWAALVRKYGEPRVPASMSIQSRLIRFYVNDHPDPLSIVHDAPLYRIVMLVARVYKMSRRTLYIRGVSEHLDSCFTGTVRVGDYVEDGDRLHVSTAEPKWLDDDEADVPNEEPDEEPGAASGS